MTRIALLQGHPDVAGGHLVNALEDAYLAGAAEAGHEVRRIPVAGLSFPLLRSADDFYNGAAPQGVLAAQEAIRWADHLVILYPLWYGNFPAILHGLLEQIFRPGFAMGDSGGGLAPKRLFVGKTARIVVTMGMPAAFYRWVYRAHSLKVLQRNLLGFVGFAPVWSTLIGMQGAGMDTSRYTKIFPTLGGTAIRRRRLAEMRRLGRLGR